MACADHPRRLLIGFACVLTLLTGCAAPPGSVALSATYGPLGARTVAVVQSKAGAIDAIEKTAIVPAAEAFDVSIFAREFNSASIVEIRWTLDGKSPPSVAVASGDTFPPPFPSGWRLYTEKFGPNATAALQNYVFYGVVRDPSGSPLSRTYLLQVQHNAEPTCGKLGKSCCTSGPACTDGSDCRGGLCSVPCVAGGACTAASAKGACRNGKLVCGTLANTCTAGTPKTETCNGTDDDCDGIVDNVAPSACDATPSSCQPGFKVKGTTTCAAGVSTCNVASADYCSGCGVPGCGSCAGEVCSGPGSGCPPGVECGPNGRCSSATPPACGPCWLKADTGKSKCSP